MKPKKPEKVTLPIRISKGLKERIKKIVTGFSDYKTTTEFVTQAIKEKLNKEEAIWGEIDDKFKEIKKGKGTDEQK